MEIRIGERRSHFISSILSSRVPGEGRGRKKVNGLRMTSRDDGVRDGIRGSFISTRSVLKT